jgi:primosomal protein N' (replication factor Y)
MLENSTLFADIILPLALPRLFTYRVPRHLENQVAELQRVIVPFGKKKRYSGIIHKLHQVAPAEREARYIEDILDHEPTIDSKQLEFWEWLATYYMCSLGEVMNATLPSGMKLSSETVIRALELGENEEEPELTDREQLILDALSVAGELSLKDVAEITGIKTVFPILRTMMEKRLVVSDEDIKDVFKRKTEIFVHLAEEFKEEGALNALLNQLSKAPKQEELLLAFMSSSNGFNEKMESVSRKELLKRSGAKSTVLLQMVKKGIFVAESRTISRLGGNAATSELVSLSDPQTQALEEIRLGFSQNKVVLLHGLTGSGKTEIYIQLIRDALDRGEQVLYMLPEIALTSQIINRLRIQFGRKVQVYHSRFSENERMEVWQAVSRQSNEGSLIVGARSSLFLPFRNLGLILVDEEHDSSYKQNDPAPRYQGRDAAIYMSGLYETNILLGTATPSVESYYHAMSGKYQYVRLSERFGGAVLPEIQIADLKEDTRKQKMQGIFSPTLIKNIAETTAKQKQSILFRNRRGFAPMLECNKCRWIPHCVQCDISLTYHKSVHQLKCHYCGYSMNVPSKCGECESTDMRMKGFGTEKIEEELGSLIPELRIARMDLDTTRSKNGHHKLIEDFQEQRIDVLIGTQMISKGLDFDHVQLVAVLSADSMLNYPDFRAFERSFQLLSQVSGRAGRRKEPGLAIIQTWKPDHPVLEWVKNHDYDGFYANEIDEREKFGYPPFTRLINLSLRHESNLELDEAADRLGAFLRITFGGRILGPEYPPVSRIRNQFQKNIMLKIEPKASLKKVKDELNKQISRFFSEFPLKGYRLVIDVDPYN